MSFLGNLSDGMKRLKVFSGQSSISLCQGLQVKQLWKLQSRAVKTRRWLQGNTFMLFQMGMFPLLFFLAALYFIKMQPGNLQVSLIPWEKEAFCKMPANLWQKMMDIYFPNSRWLRVTKRYLRQAG